MDDAASSVQTHQMNEESTSRFAWAAAFEPNEIEQFILMAAAKGASVTPDPDEQIVIRAKFLQILLLGLRDDWPVAPVGVRIGFAGISPAETAPQILIDGCLDLLDARNPEGGPLPPLVLRNCAFNDGLMLQGASINKLDLSGSQNLKINASEASFERGVRLDGAQFSGEAHFNSARIGGSFSASNATFRGPKGAPLRLDGAQIDGNVFLNQARIFGEANCASLKAEQFNAAGAQFIHPKDYALRLDGASVGSVAMNDTRAFGVIYCIGMRIEGGFDALGARFLNRGGVAVVMQSSRIHDGVKLTSARIIGQAHFDFIDTDGPVFLDKTRLSNRHGEVVRLISARIGGRLVLDNAQLHGFFPCNNMELRGEFEATNARFESHSNMPALSLAGAKMGRVLLNNTKIRGQLVANESIVEGGFHAVGVEIYNRGGIALSMQRARVENLIQLTNAKLLGEVNCDGLSAMGQFLAGGARFCNKQGDAISLGSGASVQGGLSLPGSRISGTLAGQGAKLWHLSAVGACLRSGGDNPAIDCRVATIDLGVDLGVAHDASGRPRPTYIKGPVHFDQARIGGQVTLSGSNFKASKVGGGCLSFAGARIEGIFHTHDLASRPDGWFSLAGADIASIDDDLENGWPQAGQLNLDGLSYRSIRTPKESDGRSKLSDRRIAWLKLQYENGTPKHGEFRPQPFEQLTKILREQGHDYAATKVSIEKRELQRKYADRGFSRFIHTILKLTSDYGYSPARALAWFIVWVGIGAGFVKSGLQNGLYERASIDNPETSHIEPFVYAFDLATPIIDFGQATAYRLKPSCMEVSNLVMCNWREILETGYSTTGFVLFSILVLTFSGVLRRE